MPPSARAETAERVDPARQAVSAAPLPEKRPSTRSAEFGTRFVPMVTPQEALESGTAQPDAYSPDDGLPASPPPAFQRSLLEGRLAETNAPDPAPATISAPAPPETAAKKPDAARDSKRDPADPEPAGPGASSDPSPLAGRPSPHRHFRISRPHPPRQPLPTKTPTRCAPRSAAFLPMATLCPCHPAPENRQRPSAPTCAGWACPTTPPRSTSAADHPIRRPARPGCWDASSSWRSLLRRPFRCADRPFREQDAPS